MGKYILKFFIFLLIFLFFIFPLDSVLAACCPIGSSISCCAGGGGGGSYTYDCTYCGATPSPTGKCCISWESTSCGCPSYTGCSGDSCSCSIGACGAPPPPPPPPPCSQPCGACFPCNACATIASVFESNTLALSFEEAEFGKISEEEIASCQQNLVQTVSAASNEVVVSGLSNPLWKLVLEDTFVYLKGIISLLIGLLMGG